MFKKSHRYLMFLLLILLVAFYRCDKNSPLVDPFENATIKIALQFPNDQRSAPADNKSSINPGLSGTSKISSFNDVTVSVLDSATQTIVIKKQELTIENNIANGELTIPLSSAEQAFSIIVFASDTQQLQFLVGTENVHLVRGETRPQPVFIQLQLPNIVEPLGTAQASSSLPDGTANATLAIDYDFSTSWFSSRSADGNSSTFTWTSTVDEFFSSAGIVNNAEHINPAFQNGHGFQAVTFQIFSGPNGTGEKLFEETVDYPQSTSLPVSTVTPLVKGRSIKLLLDGPESPDFNGFSELLVVGDPAGEFQVPQLLLLTLAPQNPAIQIGGTVQFTATGSFSDDSVVDQTSRVLWSSSAPNVASISAGGLATGLQDGTTVISATKGGINTSTVLTVRAAQLQSITISPQNSSVEVGQTLQFSAQGTFSDGSTSDITNQVTWSSSATSIATINTSGLATGVMAGNTIITAAKDGISATTGLTVIPAQLQSIAVSPLDASIEIGQTLQFSAEGTFSDGSTSDITNQVTWSSSASTIATINTSGLATGVTAGNTVITAAKDGISATTGLTVIAAQLQSIAITPQDTSAEVGQTLQFAAQGIFSDGSTSDITSQVTWSSSDPTVATVDAAGLASALTQGTTVITATQGSISAQTNLTVNAKQLSGATISNLRGSLMQLNDSTNCDIFGGPVGSSYSISLDYVDPDGDVVTGTVISVTFTFSPSGDTGSFDVTSPTISGDGFTGTLSFGACFRFSNSTSVRLLTSIFDAGNLVSNVSNSIVLDRPAGANSADKLDGSFYKSAANWCDKF